MATDKLFQIKFKNQNLSDLRNNLLKKRDDEQYACLIGKTRIFENTVLFLVYDIKYPEEKQIKDSSIVSLKVDGLFVQDVLNDIQNRVDVDTLIEVHTHPFSKEKAIFSSVDDDDEKMFASFLKNTYTDVNYGSIVLSQNQYSARLWKLEKKIFNEPCYGTIKTQKVSENIENSMFDNSRAKIDSEMLEIHNRTELLFGRNNLSNFMNDQIITIVGVGGIGSVIAENLVHMGFTKFVLVDHDLAEISNLNRMVGLTYKDAKLKRKKVSIVAAHIKKINPNIEVIELASKVEEVQNLNYIINSDWIVMATDNHYSRFILQELAFKYFIPFISVGVNISFRDNKLEDISGEVILSRIGDNLCLSCLNRLRSNEIQKVLSNDPNVREGLLVKGYVKGASIKDPAVKTLNSIMGAIAVDVLINEYTETNKSNPITVFEYNNYMKISYDDLSVKYRKQCSVCNI